jgi:hypothetical protein
LYRLQGRGDPIARGAQKLLPVLERVGLRGSWARLCDRLRFYWYLRGATDALPSLPAFDAFAREVVPQAQDVQEIVLDLRDGIAAAEAVIDSRRPESVGLRYGRHILGILPAAEGSEPWRGAHLRPFILRYLGPALLRALALDGRIIDASAADLQRLAKAIVRAGGFYTTGRLQPMWREQYLQWERLDAQLAKTLPIAGTAKPVHTAAREISERV